LSKQQSLELFASYPEDYTIICTNLMLIYDLSIDGTPIPGSEDDNAVFD
jgi:hypothetical protein